MTTEEINNRCLDRIADIFDISVSEIKMEYRFDYELKPSFVSDFKHNQLDHLQYDIDEIRSVVDDEDIIPDVVRNVGDFCSLIAKYHDVTPKYCKLLFERWEKERNMKNKPWWRRFVFDMIGY